MRDEIENILDHFDFASVKTVMDALDWKWFSSESEDGVPSIAELRKCARRLLTEVGEEVMRNNEMTAEANRATGGLRAQAYRYLDEDKIYFKLAFEVSTFDNYN